MNKTAIEWTDATWNPVTGCHKVSQGCHHCYAERIWRRTYPDRPFTDVRCHPERLDQPLRWTKPKRIFVNSMSDLFHEDVPDEFVADVFAYMAYSRQHQFQVLTKRPQRMLSLLTSAAFADLYDTSAALAHDDACDILGRRGEFDPNRRLTTDIRAMDESLPRPNVWLGVSVEDQATADERIPLLLQTPAAVRFISAEPLLGPIDIYLPHANWATHPDNNEDHATVIDWCIAGGESGPKARPSHPDWFRSLRDQCAAAGVPFFFKQWGRYLPGELKRGDPILRWQNGAKQYYNDDDDIRFNDCWLTNDERGLCVAVPCSKKQAGRLLDGREHSEYPA